MSLFVPAPAPPARTATTAGAAAARDADLADTIDGALRTDPSAVDASPADASSVHQAAAEGDDRRPLRLTEAHLLVRVGDTSFAFPVSEVREVMRATRVRRLGQGTLELRGCPVVHVDVHGRTIPVVDLRADGSEPGDVLLPQWRAQAGVVVDRVVSVLAADTLVVEPAAAIEALPAYARGVVRVGLGDEPVLLVGLPELPGPDQT